MELIITANSDCEILGWNQCWKWLGYTYTHHRRGDVGKEHTTGVRDKGYWKPWDSSVTQVRVLGFSGLLHYHAGDFTTSTMFCTPGFWDSGNKGQVMNSIVDPICCTGILHWFQIRWLSSRFGFGLNWFSQGISSPPDVKDEKLSGGCRLRLTELFLGAGGFVSRAMV